MGPLLHSALLIAAIEAGEGASGVQSGTLWIFVLLAMVAGALTFHFVRSSEGKPIASVVVALVGHVAFLALLSLNHASISC